MTNKQKQTAPYTFLNSSCQYGLQSVRQEFSSSASPTVKAEWKKNSHLFAKWHEAIAPPVTPIFLESTEKSKLHPRPYYLIILVARDKHQNGAWNLGCRCLSIRDGSTTWQRLPVPAGLETGECRDLNHVVSTYAGRIHKKRFIIVFSVWNVIFAIFFLQKCSSV